MKASLFIFSVLAAIAAAKTATDVANNKPSPTVQHNTKTIQQRENATHEAETTPTALEEREVSLVEDDRAFASPSTAD